MFEDKDQMDIFADTVTGEQSCVSMVSVKILSACLEKTKSNRDFSSCSGIKINTYYSHLLILETTRC